MDINKQGYITGKLVRWYGNKGFGFIEHVDHEKGIFIHITAFQISERKPRIGDTITYKIGTGRDDKIQATDATIDGVKIVPEANRSTTRASQHKSAARQQPKQNNNKWIFIAVAVIIVAAIAIKLL